MKRSIFDYLYTAPSGADYLVLGTLPQRRVYLGRCDRPYGVFARHETKECLNNYQKTPLSEPIVSRPTGVFKSIQEILGVTFQCVRIPTFRVVPCQTTPNGLSLKYTIVEERKTLVVEIPVKKFLEMFRVVPPKEILPKKEDSTTESAPKQPEIETRPLECELCSVGLEAHREGYTLLDLVSESYSASKLILFNFCPFCGKPLKLNVKTRRICNDVTTFERKT